jgi:prolipoprotein diacylglyceryltransferase
MIESMQDNFVFSIVAAIFGMVSALGVFFIWGRMFYDWGQRNFPTKASKRNLFLLMVLGMFLGAIVYYFMIVERNKYAGQE